MKQHNCLQLGSEHIWSFETAPGKTQRVTLSGNFQSNNGKAILHAACAGVGIALKLIWDAGPSIDSGELVPLLADYPIVPERNIWAVWAPSPIIPARTRVFTEFLKEKLKTLPGH